MSRFTVYTIPENVELLPGSKLHFHHKDDSGFRFYREEASAVAAADIRQKRAALDMPDFDTSGTNTTSQAQQ